MSIRVLIADNDPSAGAVAEMFLDNGCRVRLSRNVPEALEELKKGDFDVLLADAGLGAELLPSIKSGGPRLILTAGGGDGGAPLQILHRELGVKDYLDVCAHGNAAGLKRVVFVDERVDPTSRFSQVLESVGHKVVRGPLDGPTWASAAKGQVDVVFLDAGPEGWRAWRGLPSVGVAAVMPAGPCGEHVAARLTRGAVPVVDKNLGEADLEGLVKACLRNVPRAFTSLLLVDDDGPFRESIADFLRGEGFQVEEAACAEDGFKKSEARPYDVIISDYHLPDASGIQMIGRIRVVRPDAKIVLLTGGADLDSAMVAVDLRIHAYLSKPVNPDTLLSVLERALREARLEGQVKDLMKELRAANEKLESFDRLKSSFLFLVAHDIRSPLSGAKGFVDFVIARNPDLPPKIKEEMGMVGNALEQVNRLVSDLMDLGRMETGKLRVEPEDMDLRAFSKDLRQRFQILAEKERVGLVWDDARAPERVTADPLRLDQVISNLVGNALKHAGVGKTVSVALSAGEGGGLSFDVKDDGRGLKPEDVARVFEPYYQGDDGMALKKGIGLGLAIVRELVEAHGGRVWAESAGEGKGCTFCVRLPAKAPAAEPAAKG